MRQDGNSYAGCLTTNVEKVIEQLIRYMQDISYKFVNPLEDYEIVKVVNNTVERKLREELEILKEREKGLDNLINIKIKFDNEEIFYNIIKK